MASEDFIDLSSSDDDVIEREKTEVEEHLIAVHSSSTVVVESEENEVKVGFTELFSSSNLVTESEQTELNLSTSKPSEANTQSQSSLLFTEDIVDGKNSDQGKEDGEIEDDQLVQTMEVDNLVDEPHMEGFNLVDTTKEAEKINGRTHKDHSTANTHGVDESPKSGVKRARMTYIDNEPSVHVIYKSLTSASKRKLEELLQQWSQWQAQQTSSTNDSNETLESGEQTLFPALRFGLEKASTVSYWIDNQTKNEQNKFIPLDGDSVPMYDRGFALGLTSDDGSTNVEGGVETVGDSRCFNCGSYSHGLKDCKKPRDHAAVDSARKLHNANRVQSSGPRNAARYYQNTPGGKYDGIRPGFLTSEARQLLGVGELDPPPWLQRMRELGYPPGYLDPDYEDQPSGITIYADETTKDGEEDGEKLGNKNPHPKKKMSVEFPGINAPIPENADERRWAPPLPETPTFDPSRNRSYPIPIPGDLRRAQDYRDDGPPGSNNSPRYNGYDPSYAHDSYGSNPNQRPGFGRSLSDRGRWSPQVHDGSPSSPYSPTIYGSSPNASLRSPQSYGSLHKSSSDSLSRRYDHHRHHRR